MSSLPNSSDVLAPLLWTIGFSGKRMLDPVQEDNLRRGLSHALDYLSSEARKQSAGLTAVSSIARGADVLFANACLGLEAGRSGQVIPWKCLLPFAKEEFFRLDLERISALEADSRRKAAEACLAASPFSLPVNTCSTEVFDPADVAARDEAYLACGYRTVDEADVMVFAITGAEWNEVVAAEKEWKDRLDRWKEDSREVQARWKAWVRELWRNQRRMKESQPPQLPQVAPNLELPPPPGRAGTIAVVRYALASKRPCLFLNADDPECGREHLLVLSNPGRGLFVDVMITPLIGEMLKKHGPLPADPTGRSMVRELLVRLDQAANEHQNAARKGLEKTIGLHFLASGVAACFATVLHFSSGHWEVLRGWSHLGIALLLLIVLLALVKPLFAFWAIRVEDKLHHHGVRDQWTHHRILAEICRGALARWDLPEQPLDELDEEDFPKVKRMIRSLRLLRERAARAVREAAPPSGSRRAGETATEAAFREATEIYIRERLEEQAVHYGTKHWAARRDEHWWRGVFKVSLWTAVSCGFVLFLYKSSYFFKEHHEMEGLHWAIFDPFAWLAALSIIAPFAATYALGKITISDCHRRTARYEEMHHYLLRLAATLRACESVPSRLRLIEQAERMMIEEQHEWFSVTRNYSV